MTQYIEEFLESMHVFGTLLTDKVHSTHVTEYGTWWKGEQRE